MEGALSGIHIRALTLDEELARLGIPVLPTAQVKAHKQLMLRSDRVGVWRMLWPIARSVKMLKERAFESLIRLLTLVGIFAAFFLSWTVMWLTAVASVATLLLYVILNLCENRNPWSPFWRAATAYWESMSFHDVAMPPNVLHRALVVGSIPKTHIRVERFKTDPFLCVRRGFQKRYIGAWDTDTLLDRI